ncbi:MAG: HAMP domain-containing sensor histidine kinase [Solirubrobacteraceae bacterium]
MRRRLLIAIAGVAALAVTLFAIPLSLALERSYRDDELLRLQRDAFAATRAIDVSTTGGDPIELPASPRAIAVYDGSGRRVAGRVGPARADALTRAANARRRPLDLATDGRLVVAVPLVVGERVSGALRAERSDAVVASRAHRAWLALAGLALAVLALATTAAFLVARRLAAPLERLAGAARRLGDGDFGARAPRAGVAEVDEVGAALDATAQRLDGLVTRERSFSADASHQLRTPLAALRLELEALELRGEELPAALAQVDRLQETIDTLLAVARDTQPGSATADLGALVDGAERRWRGPLAADGRPLRVLVTAVDPVARAAPRVVDEILDVLLANAHRHGDGLVTATVRDAAGRLAVEVADEGEGFAVAPEEAFARRGGSNGGHGIGLALARSLAHAEGGRLEVVEPGRHPVVRLLIRASA